MSTLKKGSTGPEVVYLQHLLVNRGYKTTIDGSFGPMTEGFVKDFQTKHALAADGIVTDSVLELLKGVPQVPMVCGIDVSHYQTGADFAKIKNSNVKFVYCKATEGTQYHDPSAKAHATGAKANGIKVGYYHFASLNDPNAAADAMTEAKYFDAYLKTLPESDLMPVLDIETNKSNLSPALVQQWVSSFVGTMTQLGRKTMLYSYTPFIDQYFPANHPFGALPLWLAQYKNVDYPSMPHGWQSYTVWQFSNTGKIDGIPGGTCDVNKAPESFLTM